MTHPVWQLAISSLAGRKGRSALLVAAVALATMLATGVIVAMHTLESSFLQGLGRHLGAADVRLKHKFNGYIDQSIARRAADWPQVELATPIMEAKGVQLILPGRTGPDAPWAATTLRGIVPGAYERFFITRLSGGHMPEARDEIVIDQFIAEKLGVDLGDTVQIDPLMMMDRSDPDNPRPINLQIVGRFDRPRLVMLQEPVALALLETAQMAGGRDQAVSRVEVKLRDGVDASALEQAHGDALPDEIAIETPMSKRAGMDHYLYAMRMTTAMVVLLVYISAGSIILISLTTAVGERTRELAVLRCVGATRRQIGLSQLLSGAIVTGSGACIGAPLGVLAAYIVYRYFRDFFEAGFTLTGFDVVGSIAAAMLAGLVGAGYPAWRAATLRPLKALANRAKEPRTRGMVLCLVFGGLAVLTQPLVMMVGIDADRQFWFYITVGLPLLSVGFFVLSVPLLWLIGATLLPLLSVLLGLPRNLLQGVVFATPYRHALTGAALMIGVMLLVSTWTLGRSDMRQMVDQVDIPDLFIPATRRPLPEDKWRRLQQVEGVEIASPAGVIKPKLVDARFGATVSAPDKTHFLMFHPETFFQIAQVQWVEGDQQSAVDRLRKGEAVIVGREYREVHQAEVGDSITLEGIHGPQSFEVAGVIENKGLDMAVAAMDLQSDYDEAAINFVFGTRADGRKHFGREDITLVLIRVTPGADVRTVQDRILKETGLVSVAAPDLLDEIRGIARTVMLVISTIAAASLLIACFGVSNLIAAEVQARRFEYGVLRAVGAPRGMLARLVVGQALTIAIVGCAIGFAMSIETVLIRQSLVRQLFGFKQGLVVAWDVVALGFVTVSVAALVASAVPMWRLTRTHPRELLAARG